MKKFLLFSVLFLILSCKKYAETNIPKADSTKIIDSINAVRTRINDSILSHHRFRDWEGTHILIHDMISGKGKITFSKIGRDEYNISGEDRNGQDFVKIKGIGRMISEKHLSFDGTIKQSLQDNDNGKLDVRKGNNKTFLTKDGGKTFRLQESLNSSGFVDHIDIKF